MNLAQAGQQLSVLMLQTLEIFLRFALRLEAVDDLLHVRHTRGLLYLVHGLLVVADFGLAFIALLRLCRTMKQDDWLRRGEMTSSGGLVVGGRETKALLDEVILLATFLPSMIYGQRR